mmetsp:Transcript_4301/g.7533  ORF Transcript_4301/g.7533 Transcript_4301/m.7533 type:complete len:489 (+) Transcript_4301:34-1500(+)
MEHGDPPITPQRRISGKRKQPDPADPPRAKVCREKQDGRLHLPHPVLRLRDAGQGPFKESTDELTFQFRRTPASTVRTVDSLEEFDHFLREETAKAIETQKNWLRQPRADWIAQMIRELQPSQRKRLRRRHHVLQAADVPEENTFVRWGETSEFASVAIDIWFEGKSLEEVLQRAKDLGHMDEELVQGCFLEGAVAEELARGQQVDFDELLPMLRKLCGRDSKVSVYKVRKENCFEQEQRFAMPIGQLKPQEGQGSLNTTWDFERSSSSNVDLLDEYHKCVAQALEESSETELNRLLYLIWKFPHYVTSYHQDTHVPPHYTIYNQVSGTSLFHFLPLLVGLYVTHVGRRDVEKLASVLGRLDELGIGSLAAIGPGQMAFIMPFGSHGVWVPSPAYNPTLSSHAGVSLIRAAEVFLKPFKEETPNLTGATWNKVLEMTSEEVAEFHKFLAFQRSISKQLQLSSQDWGWMAAMSLRPLREDEEQAESDKG